MCQKRHVRDMYYLDVVVVMLEHTKIGREQRDGHGAKQALFIT